MSDARYASITSALLARKGEAAPSVVDADRFAPLFETRPAAPPPAQRKRPAVVSAIGRKRRVVITLSSEEFVRLGIVAAKKNSTRHDLVRDALFDQLDAYARDQADDCRCINSDEACDCEEPADRIRPEIPALATA